jgi:hypothetical protein
MEDNELMMTEEFEDIDMVESCEDNGNLVIGIGVGACALVAAAVGGIALYMHKTKDKREAKKIEKLRQKGYMIFTPEEVASSKVASVEEHE